jgi:hypothetical protein
LAGPDELSDIGEGLASRSMRSPVESITACIVL